MKRTPRASPPAYREPPAFVLLHGFTGAPASWDEVVARLPPGARVLRPALVGHAGRLSGADGAPADFIAEVDRLAALVRAEGFAGAHLAGYSLGGRVALGLIARHPTLFARATVIGAHPGLPEPETAGPGYATRIERARSDEQWARVLDAEGAARFFELWEGQPLFATQRGLPPERLAAQARVRAGHDAGALAHALRALSLARMPDLRPALAHARVPLAFLAGALDDKFAALALATAERLSPAHAELVPGAGHNLLLERPDAVAEALSTPKEPA